VYLSVGRHRRVPRRYRGHDVFWWRRTLGHLDQSAEDTPQDQRMPPPLVTGVRGGHDVDIRAYAASGMTLLGGIVDARDGRVALADDLEHNLRNGDVTFDEFIRAVDDHIRRAGLEAPAAPDRPARDAANVVPPSVREIDLHAAGIRAVIWATGYALDFGWIELPIFDRHGDPVHRRGVTAAPGVYLLGLAWLHKPKSSFLYGVGEDAGYLAQQIASRA
jgi:putative flavoprotein involved in K+ transport